MHKAKPRTVDEWLAYIESIHPKSIEMGLERALIVADRLNLKPKCKVITVAGTNGKGSTCAMLTQIYVDAGYDVGTYTSPHLIRYQERVRVNQLEIGDHDLCLAFQAVEDVRGDVALTYFEMGTLAAMWHFSQRKLDVLILEVGLGGRLDTVNLFDADCAIVTNVDLDHMEFLGDTREAIGAEKAGVYRQHQISICGDLNPPNSLIQYARQIGTNLRRAGIDFDMKPAAEGWCYQDADGQLEIPNLNLIGRFQAGNAATVVHAVKAMNANLNVSDKVIVKALAKVQLTGRFHYLQQQPDVILDVAHNPQAAQSLIENLQLLKPQGRLIAVFSMLADKDIDGVVKHVVHSIDEWHIAPIHHPRAASTTQLKTTLRNNNAQVVQECLSLEEAFVSGFKNLMKNDKIIVFGSFFTVAAVLIYWQTSQANLNSISVTRR